MSKTATVLLVAAGVAAGFACGRMTGGFRLEGVQVGVLDGKEAELAKKRIVALEKQLQSEQAAKLDAAKTSRELKKLLAKKKEQAPGVAEATMTVVTNGDVTAELEKQLDGETFAAATNAMAEIRAKMAKNAQNRVEYLRSIDVSRMSEADRKTHERYLSLLARREELAEKTKNAGLIPDVASLTEMVALDMEMKPVAQAERSALLRGIAGELGYEGEDVEVFHDAVEAVFDCTGQNTFNDVMDGAVQTIQIVK